MPKMNGVPHGTSSKKTPPWQGDSVSEPGGEIAPQGLQSGERSSHRGIGGPPEVWRQANGKMGRGRKAKKGTPRIPSAEEIIEVDPQVTEIWANSVLAWAHKERDEPTMRHFLWRMADLVNDLSRGANFLFTRSVDSMGYQLQVAERTHEPSRIVSQFILTIRLGLRYAVMLDLLNKLWVTYNVRFGRWS